MEAFSKFETFIYNHKNKSFKCSTRLLEQYFNLVYFIYLFLMFLLKT